MRRFVSASSHLRSLDGSTSCGMALMNLITRFWQASRYAVRLLIDGCVAQLALALRDVPGPRDAGQAQVFVLSQSLCDALAAAGLNMRVASIVTQTVVRADDPAMKRPTKPIGPFYSREIAEERKRQLGWEIVEDAARGYRRVVPSPEPVEIVELDVIQSLMNQGVLVVACGGGGIPVVRNGGELKGVEAVIDKDRASALLASKLGMESFAISTDIDFVYLDYKKPTQRALKNVTAAELEDYYRTGHFPPGNMGPKVESALRFLKAGGKEVLITSYEHLVAAAAGSYGTRITRESADAVSPSKEREIPVGG